MADRACVDQKSFSAELAALARTSETVWYPLLVQSKKGSLLSVETVKSNENLTVCADLACRKKAFSKFETYLHYYAWTTRVPAEERRFYEVIDGHVRQKLYFDVDLKVASLPSSATEAAVEAAVAAFADVAATAIGSQSVLVFSSSSIDAGKLSFHVVVDNVYLASNVETRAACVFAIAEFCAKPPQMRGGDAAVAEAVASAVDAAVYSSRQQFRIMGCRKVGTDRVKRFRPDLSTFSPPQTGGAAFFEIRTLSSSLVTEISTCHPLSATCDFAIYQRRAAALNASARPRGAVSEGVDCVSADEAEALLAAVAAAAAERYGACDFPFALRDEFGPFFSTALCVIVPLVRKAPSFCPMCDKTHDNDHPYLLVFPDAVSFCCRRGTRRLTVLRNIGSFDPQRGGASRRGDDKSRASKVVSVGRDAVSKTASGGRETASSLQTIIVENERTAAAVAAGRFSATPRRKPVAPAQTLRHACFLLPPRGLKIENKIPNSD